MSKTFLSACVILLTLLAAIPRLHNLGGPGFYGDEETTAFAARSLATGDAAVMPSGMPYHRALPFTWLNAKSAMIFGVDDELSYRVPAALLGIATVPALFLLLAPLVGRRAAFFASLLLALSEWHVLTSREARMYAPFLFFFAVTSLSTLRWSLTGDRRHLLLAAASFPFAASMHILSTFVALFALVPMLLPSHQRAKSWQLLTFAATAIGISIVWYQAVETAAYASWGARPGAVSLQRPDSLQFIPAHFADLAIPYGFSIVAGIGAGARAAVRLIPGLGSGLLRRVAFLVAALSCGAMAALGQVYGAALAVAALMLIYPRPVRSAASAAALPLVAMLALLILNVAVLLVAIPDTTEALKTALRFPHPYPLMLLRTAPGVTVLAGASIAALCVLAAGSARRTALTIGALIFVVALTAVGAVSRWEGMRYFTPVIPLYLVLAAAALTAADRWLTARAGRGPMVSAALILVCLSGVLGAHGLPQAWRAASAGYGDEMTPEFFGFEHYPDHRSAGLYVRERLGPDDLVVAEDQIQQRWYAGRVDYWLRDPAGSAIFLYQADDGELRDIYAGSRPFDPEGFERRPAAERPRTWLITSAEPGTRRAASVTPAQRAWVDEVERSLQPAFTAQDGRTKVFCLNCGDPSGLPPRDR